ncbi:MAG: hypothetical protein GC150_08915 [Rhizobiales bacterium]|nr:hypothetical protein [Hyphomicrobiales bacterium]
MMRSTALPARRARPRQLTRSMLTAASAVAFTLLSGAGPAAAVDEGLTCSDASSGFFYEGGQLFLRDPANPAKVAKLASKQLSSTVVARDSETCVTRNGKRFQSQSTLSVTVIEFDSPWGDGKLQVHFLCDAFSSDFPVDESAEVTCSKRTLRAERIDNVTLKAEQRDEAGQ